MKIEKKLKGKLVYCRLRVGGSYTGVVTDVQDTYLDLKTRDGTEVRLQNGMIASLQIMEMSKVD